MKVDGSQPVAEFTMTPVALNGCRVLVLAGELDMREAEALESAMFRPGNGPPIVVDLSELTYIDSSGLHALLQPSSAGRPDAFVRRPGSSVGRVLDIVDAEKAVPVYDDVATAVEQLGSG